MGYGVLKIDGGTIALLGYGTVKMPVKDDAYKKLLRIHNQITEIIVRYAPTEFAIEAPFFGKNVQSMLKLGRAQGVAIAAAMQAGMPIEEYSPRKVKQSITGNGNASKEQVLSMLLQILQIQTLGKDLDATDALAVALCHHYQSNALVPAAIKKAGKKNSWDQFVATNPGRVK